MSSCWKRRFDLKLQQKNVLTSATIDGQEYEDASFSDPWGVFHGIEDCLFSYYPEYHLLKGETYLSPKSDVPVERYNSRTVVLRFYVQIPREDLTAGPAHIRLTSSGIDLQEKDWLRVWLASPSGGVGGIETRAVVLIYPIGSVQPGLAKGKISIEPQSHNKYDQGIEVLHIKLDFKLEGIIQEESDVAHIVGSSFSPV